MIIQPTPPPVPAAPILSAQERASIADGIRQGHAIQVQAQLEAQQVIDQTNRELAQGGPGGRAGATSVIKDATGRVVVTGPGGKTVIIDPKAGLDEDQVQSIVERTLQPVPIVRDSHDSADRSHKDVQMIAIIFGSLLVALWMILRVLRRRPAPAGATTAVLPPEAVARLARIEQAVEAVAIEVERISEAQRYSAQLLTERLSVPALGGAPTAPAMAPAARADRA